jgi:putative ubiquitin-RnfH superfamily antitoxin RatB of RatAB toxin-antitoxin module
LDASDEAFSDLSEQEFQSLMADLGDPKQVTVEVVYATKVEQAIHEVQLAQGASIEDCIIMSGILDGCPDIDLSVNKVGINGAVKPLSERVADTDRIEIYRPVTAEV